jgi:hypothetical protein
MCRALPLRLAPRSVPAAAQSAECSFRFHAVINAAVGVSGRLPVRGVPSYGTFDDRTAALPFRYGRNQSDQFVVQLVNRRPGVSPLQVALPEVSLRGHRPAFFRPSLEAYGDGRETVDGVVYTTVRRFTNASVEFHAFGGSNEVRGDAFDQPVPRLRTVAAELTTVPLSAQEFKVIVNAANSTADLPAAVASKFFPKEAPAFPNGTPATPVDQAKSTSVRVGFSKRVSGRPVAAIETYWPPPIHSGKEVLPASTATDDDVIAFVKATPGGIGYVSAWASTAGVKVVELSSRTSPSPTHRCRDAVAMPMPHAAAAESTDRMHSGNAARTAC